MVPWEYAERINLERLEMTVKIEGSALSIPESLDSLEITPLVMHRIWFQLHTVKEWYAVMNEARVMFGKNCSLYRMFTYIFKSSIDQGLIVYSYVRMTIWSRHLHNYLFF